MKDVSDILSKRLAKLDALFSRDWVADFLMLMEYIETNSFTQQTVTAIQEKKQQAHSQLLGNLSLLVKDGTNCLRQIKSHRGSNNAELREQIKYLQQVRVDSSNITDPFFELETIYHDYYTRFSNLLKTIAQGDTEDLISQYCSLTYTRLQGTEHVNIDLLFSPYLQLCQQDIEILAGERESSIWGKWDALLRWKKWTERGIAPTNDVYEHNLSDLFVGQKILESVQSCGLYFLECLTNTPLITTASQKCLKALEIFIDSSKRYWIIAHFEGQKDDNHHYFIKKLQADSNSYRLAKLLIDAEAHAPIDFPNLSHTLGELEIKNELKKVFFTDGNIFSGSCVQLGGIECPINSSLVIDTLNALERQKKYLPTFNHRDYFGSLR